MKLDQVVVDEYAQAYCDEQKLPPIIVWNCTNDDKMYLVDGFHRVEGAKIAGLKELSFVEKSGSYREAVLFSVSVNSSHGLRRSNEDKRKAVITLLTDPEWSQWSNRAIAQRHFQ